MKLSSFQWLAAGVVLSAIGVGATAFNNGSGEALAGTSINWKTSAVSNTTNADVSNDATSQNYAKSLSGAFRSASDEVLPAVVTIRSTAIASLSRSNGQGGNIPEELRNNPMFKRFFEGMPEGNFDAPQGRERQGMGSGVIIDSSGIILTNNHVVDGASRLLIKLHDGREFEAKEWKTDPKTDIAVVKIDSPTSLPVAAIGDSDGLDIGDWVIAVGAPFGLDETVTAGIISAKSRGIGITAREEFLQTDAEI
ncbi:MAG: trypsin-like peptidase domain-containing protein, partial [Planctomycetota bacterium]|nr:trypsin-like peptidase domain-containing protein [Planctomycetota bacterium]